MSALRLPSTATSAPNATGAPPLLPRRAALFLDLDGTLAPIAPTPQSVRMPDWVRPVLGRLREQLSGAVAVVSGRPLAGLDGLLRPLRLPAAGVHGIERRLADGRIRVHRARVPEAVRRVAQALADTHPALLLEAKPGALALHYRALPELGTLCRTALTEALHDEPGWEAMAGRCVVEVKPRSVSKGQVVAAFLCEAVFAGRVPVFVGDDTSDEDAIAVAQAAGGYGVRVGPGASAAIHRLADVEAVGRWLQTSADALDAAH